MLEYDRGTESARKYAAKLRAYYQYRDSGQAARDYDGMPVILFVTTSPNAEDRMAAQAQRAWFYRGAEPLQVLLTTTERISRHTEGVLGPIWRRPSEARGDLERRTYWLADGTRQGRARGDRAVGASASFDWTTPVRSNGVNEAKASKRAEHAGLAWEATPVLACGAS